MVTKMNHLDKPCKHKIQGKYSDSKRLYYLLPCMWSSKPGKPMYMLKGNLAGTAGGGSGDRPARGTFQDLEKVK